MGDRPIAVIAARAGAPRGRVAKALRDAGLQPADHHPSPSLVVVLEDAPRPQWPGVPMIVVSSRRDIDSFTNAITSGAAAYLTVPVDGAALTAAARRLAAWRPAPAAGNTRRSPRRPLLLEVDLEVDGRRFAGHLVEVAAGGCRVETSGRIRRGQHVTLIPHALGASTGIALGATATWTRMDDERGVCTVALRFNATSALLAPRIFGALPPSPELRPPSRRRA